jgi:hypothetical protein
MSEEVIEIPVIETTIETAALNPFLDEALTSSWTMTCASLILICGQVGFTLLELA